MRVLFLHQNFPAQFVHLSRALRQRGCDVRAITDVKNAQPDIIPTTRYEFDVKQENNPRSLFHTFDAKILRGQAVLSAMLDLKSSGFDPDLVIGHLGWGETLFVKDVWQNCKLIVHAEFFYKSEGGDSNFDPEFASTLDAKDLNRRLVINVKNAAILLALINADYGVSPTRWQGNQFPLELRSKIVILHEGIDTNLARPRRNYETVSFALQESGAISQPTTLASGDEVITFVSRNLEPYRGYHIFMRALPKILLARPKAHIVIVGGDNVSYGPQPPNDQSWKQVFYTEVERQIDRNRVHFVGRLSYPDLIRLFQISSVHVYLTYPFVLSWSLLDAMSVGTLVVASRTSPVEEIIVDGQNGFLVDFFDHEQLAMRVIGAISKLKDFEKIRRSARRTIVDRYDLYQVCLPRWFKFIDAITPNLMGKTP